MVGRTPPGGLASARRAANNSAVIDRKIRSQSIDDGESAVRASGGEIGGVRVIRFTWWTTGIRGV